MRSLRVASRPQTPALDRERFRHQRASCGTRHAPRLVDVAKVGHKRDKALERGLPRSAVGDAAVHHPQKHLAELVVQVVRDGLQLLDVCGRRDRRGARDECA